MKTLTSLGSKRKFATEKSWAEQEWDKSRKNMMVAMTLAFLSVALVLLSQRHAVNTVHRRMSHDAKA